MELSTEAWEFGSLGIEFVNNPWFPSPFCYLRGRTASQDHRTLAPIDLLVRFGFEGRSLSA